MASNWSQKGSVVLTWVGSRGVRLRSSWVSWCEGKAEQNRAMRFDSAVETVGLGVMSVTLQPWRRKSSAVRRHGLRWPKPALGRKAKWTTMASELRS